ncbi:hypothetical protein LT493_40010 [Streptomyces tricolor]|nr:hypothetical protein [Streptomyces tricolor]
MRGCPRAAVPVRDRRRELGVARPDGHGRRSTSSLRADAAGPPRPKTAAVVALGAGGSVTPSGDVSAFGRKAAEARTAVEFTPLGVGLGGSATAVLGLRTIRPHDRGCAQCRPKSRARGRGGGALPGRARRSVPGRARRRDRRRHLARPGPAAGRRRRGR